MMRRFLTLSTLAAMVVACGADDPADPGAETAGVRFVHAIPDTGALDMRVSSALDPAFAAVPYGTGTTYVPVKVGTLTFAVQPSPSQAAGTPRAISTLSQIRLTAGSVVTLLGAGQARDTTSGRAAALSAYVDDATLPPAGQARVRVINASADADGLDVYLTPVGAALPATPTFAGVDYRSSVTKNLTGGTFAVTVTALAEPSVVLARSTIVAPDGRARTLVLSGFLGTAPVGLPQGRGLRVIELADVTPAP